MQRHNVTVCIASTFYRVALHIYFFSINQKKLLQLLHNFYAYIRPVSIPINSRAPACSFLSLLPTFVFYALLQIYYYCYSLSIWTLSGFGKCLCINPFAGCDKAPASTDRQRTSDIGGKRGIYRPKAFPLAPIFKLNLCDFTTLSLFTLQTFKFDFPNAIFIWSDFFFVFASTTAFLYGRSIFDEWIMSMTNCERMRSPKYQIMKKFTRIYCNWNLCYCWMHSNVFFSGLFQPVL